MKRLPFDVSAKHLRDVRAAAQLVADAVRIEAIAEWDVRAMCGLLAWTARQRPPAVHSGPKFVAKVLLEEWLDVPAAERKIPDWREREEPRDAADAERIFALSETYRNGGGQWSAGSGQTAEAVR